MSPERIVAVLLDGKALVPARRLVEATVRLPPRGHRWIAVYTGVEPGKQVWRTTGLADRKAAQAIADEREAEARRKRITQGGSAPKKPTMRVRPGSAERQAGLLSQQEVAAILRLSVRTVREVERSAFEKLRHHPALRAFWREWMSGQIEEASSRMAASSQLTLREISALFALTRTPLERQALRKLIAVARR